MQFALVNKSKRIDDATVAFIAKACDAQIAECAVAYGVDPIPVAFYAREQDLPARDVFIVALVDDIDEGMLGYHTFEVGVVYVRVLVQADVNGTSATASHEFLETLIDRYCNAWVWMPDGKRVAKEVSDPVQRDTYAVRAEIMGEARQVVLSNYVLPRWFEPAAPGNFDRLGRLSAPFSMSPGGYLIVRDQAGNVSNVFAQPRIRASTAEAAATVGAKLVNAECRTARRMRGSA